MKEIIIDNSVYSKIGQIDPVIGSVARDIIEYISVKNRDAAVDLFRSSWKLGLSKQDQGDLREFLNKNVLFPNKLEMTAHGIKKTFRFWSRSEKSKYLEFAYAVCIFIKENITSDVCVGYGTALAIGRSDDLIPHDDDIDVIISLPVEKFPTIEAGLIHLEAAFKDSRFSIRGNYLSHRHIVNQSPGFSIDVFVGIEEDGYFSSYPGIRRHLRHETVFPATLREMFGAPVLMPRAPKSYLKAVYGEKWETPDPNFNHNWDQNPFYPLLPYRG